MAVLALTILLPIDVRKSSQEPEPEPENKKSSPIRDVLKRDVLLICAAQAATFFLYGAYEFFMPLYWEEVMNMPEWVAGPLFTLLTATLLIGGPLVGRASDARGRVSFIVYGLGSLCILIILASIIPNIILQIALIVPIGIAIAATDSTTSPLVTERVDPTKRGTALGFLSTIMDVGHSSGPLVLGLLLAVSGHSYIFAFTVASAALMAIPLLVAAGLRN